jgi:pyridoxal phosphate enzyme (YggS family)
MTGDLKTRYERVLEEIEQTTRSAGRNVDEITLVVVTKGHPVPAIEALYDLGCRDIGENRVVEALEKQAALSHLEDLNWHMIGHIQSRKAGRVAGNFSLVHSLDSVKLANRLDRFAVEAGIIQDVLLQFNVSGEETKSGWDAWDETRWEDLLPEMEEVLDSDNLRVGGVMTMAPYSLNPEDARPSFARLSKLRGWLASRFEQYDWDWLSMGMSGDFVPAIEEGATILRVGTAVMGPRF